MSRTSWRRNLYYIFKHNALTCEAQKQFIHALGTPKDDIERSYFQYLCQSQKRDYKFVLCLKNIVALILLVPFCIYAKIKIRCTNTNKIHFQCIGIFIDELVDRVPNKFKNSVMVIGYPKNFYLRWADVAFICRILMRYPLSWYFILKNTVKIAMYRAAIDKYTPSIILVSAEYSFTSSILTSFVEKNNIKHINFMHGEKTFDIVDAYCHFSTFYVWDMRYILLFKQLNADKNLFIIDIPQYFFTKTKNILSIIDYKFYLGLETNDTLTRLKVIIDKLCQRGSSVKIRPHPRYTDINQLLSLFTSDIIENTTLVDINTSIMESRNIVARNSTVLFQAYLLQKNIIIDDITDHNLYIYMVETKYMMLNKPHKLLSQIIS